MKHTACKCKLGGVEGNITTFPSNVRFFVSHAERCSPMSVESVATISAAFFSYCVLNMGGRSRGTLLV